MYKVIVHRPTYGMYGYSCFRLIYVTTSNCHDKTCSNKSTVTSTSSCSIKKEQVAEKSGYISTLFHIPLLLF